MQLFIRPVDTQFHRSGLPFDAGQYTETTSLFPPFPRTLYGALRAWGMTHIGGELACDDGFHAGDRTESYGDVNGFGQLAIKGPILARVDDVHGLNHRLFFPFPLDFPAWKKEPRKMVFLSPRCEKAAAGWNLKGEDLAFMDRDPSDQPFSGEEVESIGGEFFLPFGLLDLYLERKIVTGVNDEAGKFGSGSLESLFTAEGRVGIARDNSKRTVKDSMLYSAQHHRMHDDEMQAAGYYLYVENHDPSFPEAGCVQIGGDFRAAGYRRIRDKDSGNWWEVSKDALMEQISKTGRFRAYFITPALFERGCAPDAPGFYRKSADCHLKVSPPCGRELFFQLKGACIGKHVSIGGWDIQKKRPKALRKAVPAGSVYFFEAKDWYGCDQATREWVSEQIFQQYNFQSWCSMEPWEDGSEYGPGREGFGIALIGGW